jgi:hypothetical protein
LYGKDAIRGANEGRAYGEKYANDIKMLDNINDFDWLRKRFDKK